MAMPNLSCILESVEYLCMCSIRQTYTYYIYMHLQDATTYAYTHTMCMYNIHIHLDLDIIYKHTFIHILIQKAYTARANTFSILKNPQERARSSRLIMCIHIMCIHIACNLHQQHCVSYMNS